MKSETFLFREGKIAYTQHGRGRAVFLIHGFMEFHEMWNYYVEMLSPYFRVVTIDLPGHGKSPCFGYVHEMDLMADCLYACMRHLKLRKVFLVGHSMGGYVSLAFAEKYVDHVIGICLMNSTTFPDSEQKKSDRDRAINLLKSGHKKLYIKEAIPNLFFREHRSYAPAIRRFKNMARKTPLQGIIAGLEGMKLRRDSSVLLKFAPFPTLFIAGEHDQLIPEKDVKRQMALAESAEFVIYEDVGHMSMIEAKDKTWTTIKRFIQKLKNQR